MVARSNLGLRREITRVGHRIVATDTKSGLMVARSSHGLRRESTRVVHMIDESGLVDACGRWVGGTCRCCNIRVIPPGDIETTWKGSNVPGIWALSAERLFIFSEKASWLPEATMDSEGRALESSIWLTRVVSWMLVVVGLVELAGAVIFELYHPVILKQKEATYRVYELYLRRGCLFSLKRHLECELRSLSVDIRSS